LRGYGVGPQALNGPETKIYPDGHPGVVDLSEAARNWGNTVEGDCQATTGFGDLHAGIKCDCDPIVAIVEIQDECMVVAYSDGVGDIFTQQMLNDWLKDTTSTEVTMDAFHTVKESLGNDPRGIFQWSPDNKPMWDDVSLLGLKLPAHH